jgi:hypothetical protein
MESLRKLDGLSYVYPLFGRDATDPAATGERWEPPLTARRAAAILRAIRSEVPRMPSPPALDPRRVAGSLCRVRMTPLLSATHA